MAAGISATVLFLAPLIVISPFNGLFPSITNFLIKKPHFIYSCRTTNRPEINGIACTFSLSQVIQCHNTWITLFLVSFDCRLIIYNFNKNTGSITSFFMQTSAFRYISQFDTAEQRKKDGIYASVTLQLKPTVRTLCYHVNTNSGIYGK